MGNVNINIVQDNGSSVILNSVVPDTTLAPVILKLTTLVAASVSASG